jgi:nicotinate phosphoribosyltransferase
MTNIRWTDRTNMTLLTDFYELTMSKGYLDNDMADTVAYFDLFFRQVPQEGGFAIMAGVEQMIEYLRDLTFTEEDLAYLASHDVFDDRFIEFLRQFKFTCDVWAIPEGTPIFPNEPIVKVRGPIIQAQMIETMLLVTINHQSLIATKTARIVAQQRAPRARVWFAPGQGYDAAVLGARAAYIAGAAGTSCTLCGEHFNILYSEPWPTAGSRRSGRIFCFCRLCPFVSVRHRLLVDTYNTLHSGVPNAIRNAREVLEPMGHRLHGIRIDSGDLAYLTVKARESWTRLGLLIADHRQQRAG